MRQQNAVARRIRFSKMVRQFRNRQRSAVKAVVIGAVHGIAVDPDRTAADGKIRRLIFQIADSCLFQALPELFIQIAVLFRIQLQTVFVVSAAIDYLVFLRKTFRETQTRVEVLPGFATIWSPPMMTRSGAASSMTAFNTVLSGPNSIL